MEWTSAAITEVFITSLALSAFGIAAFIVPIYVLGVFYRGIRSALRKRRRNAPMRGFGHGPIVSGPAPTGTA